MMDNPNIKTKVVHSNSKHAWNVVSSSLGRKHKIARVPYILVHPTDGLLNENRKEALALAEYISFCFNHSNQIISKISN